MNNKGKPDSASIDADIGTPPVDESLEQPTYDAMMRALAGRDWTNYYGLSAQWYALFKARRALAKLAPDPAPASPPLTSEGFETQK